jgi:hypothetical protein
VSYVDPSRNPLHDEESGLYHGDVPVDPSVGPILRPADDPEGFEEDHSSDMASATYVAPEATATDDDDADYESMTVEQLRPIARERGIAYADLKKAELVDALDDWDDEHAETVDDTAPAEQEPNTTGPSELVAE